MRSRAVVLVLVAVGMSLSLCAPVRASEAEAIYTYGGSFSLRIPADPSATKGWMQDAVVEVPLHLAIKDLDVSVDISHTNAFDLQLYLENPAGDAVQLNASDPFEGFYKGADYRSTTFDDEASVSIADAQPPFEGRYRPLGSLAAFDNQDACGLWKLQVYDAYYADTGSFHSFTLTITTPEPATAAFLLLGLGLLRRSRDNRRIVGATRAP